MIARSSTPRGSALAAGGRLPRSAGASRSRSARDQHTPRSGLPVASPGPRRFCRAPCFRIGIPGPFLARAAAHAPNRYGRAHCDLAPPAQATARILRAPHIPPLCLQAVPGAGFRGRPSPPHGATHPPSAPSPPSGLPPTAPPCSPASDRAPRWPSRARPTPSGTPPRTTGRGPRMGWGGKRLCPSGPGACLPRSESGRRDRRAPARAVRNR